MYNGIKHVARKGEKGRGDGALHYRGTPRHVRAEDIEELEDGPDTIELNN